MAVEIFANQPTTSVLSGGTTAPSSGTVEIWTVASSSEFPAASSTATPPTQFHVADLNAISEIIAVTNVSGNTWTVTRGSENSTPVAHITGFLVYQVVTAGALTRFQAAYGSAPDWVNVVTQFGADLSGVADSTTAINNAIAAVATTLQPVYFPAGTYQITSALNWKVPGLTVIGDGSASVTIKQTASNTPIIELAGQGQRIQGLTLEYASQQNASDTLSLGIAFGDATVGSCFMSIFEDLYVFQAYTGLGIPAALSTSSTSGLFSCTFRNIHVLGYYHHGIGLNANGGGGNSDCTGCVFENTYIHNNSGGSNANCDSYPVFLAGWTEVEFYQLNIEHGNSYDFDLISCSAVGTCVINGLHIESMNINGISGTSAFINADNVSAVIVDGMTVYSCQLVGSVENAVARFSTAGPSSVLISGYHETNGSISAPAHPWADFGSVTNCTFTVEGITASQVTGNMVNRAAGSFVRVGSVIGVIDWLNVVTMFGADPTGVADSTAAIQAAINAGATVLGNTTVYLPAGAYRISSPLVLANGTILTGDSDGGDGGSAYPPGITEITLTSGSNCSMILAPSTANYWKLSNLQLNANGAGQTGPVQTGTTGATLHVEDGGSPAELQAELDCVFIEDSYNDALYIGLNRRALYARRCKFIESGLNGSTVYGIGNGVTCNYSDHVFDACMVGGSRHHGYNLLPATASSIRITSGDIYGNGQDWVSVTPTTVAAGSNGQAVSGLTAAGVLYVASVAGFPSSGSLLINISTGFVVVSYTSISGSQFNGIAVSATEGNQGGTLTTGQQVYLLGGDAIHVGSQCSGIYIAGNSLDRNQGCGVFAETSVAAIAITGNHFTSNSAVADGLLPHVSLITPQSNGVSFTGNGVESLISGYANRASYIVQSNGSGQWRDIANTWGSAYVSTGSYTNFAAGIQPFSNGSFLMQSNNTGTITQQVQALAGQTADLTQWQAANGTVLAKIDTTGAYQGPNSVDWLNVVYGFGADPTGVNDSTTAIQAAINALPATGGTVYLPAGTYKVSSTLTCTSLYAYIQGDGRWATTINFTGTGDCLRIYNTSTTGLLTGGGVLDFTIDGLNAGAGSTGLHYGDMRAGELRVAVQNFTAAGDIGIHFDNQYGWTEECHGYLWLSNNTQNLVFDVSGNTTSTNSFGYSDFTTEILAKQNQDGVVLQNGAVLYNSRLAVRANFQGTSFTNTSAVLRITGNLPFGHVSAIPNTTVASGSDGGEISGIASWSSPSAGVLDVASTTGFPVTGGTILVAASGSTVAVITYSGLSGGNQFTGCAYVSGSPSGTVATGGVVANNAYSAIRLSRLDIMAECGNGTGSNTPQTIAFGTLGTNTIIGCIGVLDFSQGSQAFAVTNWTALGATGSFVYSGFIGGDFNLNNATVGTGGSRSISMQGAVSYGKSLLNIINGNLSVDAGDFFNSTLTGSITINLNPSGGSTFGSAQRKTIIITQAASGGPYTVTWPHTGSPTTTNCTVNWTGGTPPTMSTGASAVDVYYLDTYDGATWYGRANQNVS